MSEDKSQRQLRIEIDNDVSAEIYKEHEYHADPENARPVAISHGRLGNNVSELIASNLSSRETYVIVISFSDDEDLEEKSEVDCLVSTMQVKIANSESDYVCLKKNLDKIKDKLKCRVLVVYEI